MDLSQSLCTWYLTAIFGALTHCISLHAFLSGGYLAIQSALTICMWLCWNEGPSQCQRALFIDGEFCSTWLVTPTLLSFLFIFWTLITYVTLAKVGLVIGPLRPSICPSIRQSAILLGCLVCVICNSKNFHFFIQTLHNTCSHIEDLRT